MAVHPSPARRIIRKPSRRDVASPMVPPVDYRVADRAAWITLQRPEKRNALDHAVVSGLKEALARAASEDAVRVVVLTGAGSAFSAGADLAALEALQQAGPRENAADSRHLAGLFRDIALHPKPIVARVNGHAIAGGCGLAAVCDFALAASNARFGFTEVRIGFVPAIVAVFVLRKLGEATARDLLLRGGLIDAGRAAEIGLITKAVAPERLDDEVTSLVTELSEETSASAVALTKRLLARLPGLGLEEALDLAVETNTFARGTSDCRAGVSAFLRKEPPPWKTDR